MPYIETNGAQTFYLDEGDGQPIVFVPGMMMNHHTFDHQATVLSDRYRVIRYDVRGRGLTGPTDAEEYSFELYVDDLHELLTERGVAHPVLCGHSYGGHIAFSYASRYPTAGIVAISSGPPNIGMDLSDRQSNIVQKQTELLVLLTEEVGYEAANAALNDVLETALDGLNEDPEEVNRLISAAEMTVDEIAKVSSVGSDDGFDISRIDVPVLGLFGDMEREYFERCIETMKTHLNDIEIEVVPGAGHDLPTARADFVADTVNSFVNQNVQPETD